MPKWFRYPLGNVAMWLPLKPGVLTQDEQRWVNLVGRIRDDITPELAQQRVRQLTTQLNASAPRSGGWSISLFFLDRNTVNVDVKKTLWVLGGAVMCLLLIACANAANILLVRATARQRELAIRSALGATRGALVRQLVVESLVLARWAAPPGCSLRTGASTFCCSSSRARCRILTYSSIDIDGRVLAFATIASMVSGLLFGVGPAVRASRARGTFVSARTGPARRRDRRAKVRGVLDRWPRSPCRSCCLRVPALFARSFI